MGDRSVRFRSLTKAIDTETASGRLLYAVHGAVARVRARRDRRAYTSGNEAAKGRGIHVGRPRALAGGRLEIATEMLGSGKSKREVARLTRVSVDTITRAIRARSLDKARQRASLIH